MWLLVPGTAEVTTLEEMNYVFGVPTRRHIEYQIKTVLPWVFGRIFHPSTARNPVPLYRWEKNRQRLAKTSTSGVVENTTVRN